MKRWVWIVTLGVVLAMGGTALAHKVNLFAYVTSGVVYTESYFPDGRPVTDGKITVLDSSGVQVVTGVTDANGLFQFPVPKVDTLTIVLDASMGHKTRFVLNRIEVEAGK